MKIFLANSTIFVGFLGHNTRALLMINYFHVDSNLFCRENIKMINKYYKIYLSHIY